MGGKSESTQQTNQTQYTNPFKTAEAPLQGILGNIGGISPNPTGTENTAFNTMVDLGTAGNPFAGGITNAANSMLTGGPDRTGLAGDAYATFQGQNNKTASGGYLDPNTNPFFGATTSAITNDVRKQLDQVIAGSGRGDPSGYGSYGGILGEKIATALAPTYANQYNLERGYQENAIKAGLAGGQSTAGLLGDLDRTRFGNQVAGIGAADAATGAQMWGPQTVLAAEAARRGIPLQTLAAQMGIVLPAAQAFGTTTSTGQTTGTQQMSGADQFYKIAAGLGSLWPKGSGNFSGNTIGFG